MLITRKINTVFLYGKVLLKLSLHKTCRSCYGYRCKKFCYEGYPRGYCGSSHRDDHRAVTYIKLRTYL